MLPSSDDSEMNIMKLRVALATTTPCCCTVSGKLGVASWTLFCTCTCATSGSVPGLKYKVIVASPFASLDDDM